MKDYNTYIFDLDGTLLNTLQDLTNSVNYALRQCDMPMRTIDEVRQFVGNGVRLLMTRAVPDGDNNPRFIEAFNTFRQHRPDLIMTTLILMKWLSFLRKSWIRKNIWSFRKKLQESNSL